MRFIIRPLLYAAFKNSLAQVTGEENIPSQGSFIIAANHVDFMDGQRIGSAIYPHRDEYVKFLAQTNNYGWTGMAIQVDYHDKVGFIKTIARHLQQGEIICNFPEGKRNSSDTLLPGKTGTVRMALAARVPILPLGIIGPGGNDFMESVRMWLSGTAKYRIAIGKPLLFKKYFGHDEDRRRVIKLTGEVMKAISQLCNKKSP